MIPSPLQFPVKNLRTGRPGICNMEVDRERCLTILTNGYLWDVVNMEKLMNVEVHRGLVFFCLGAMLNNWHFTYKN